MPIGPALAVTAISTFALVALLFALLGRALLATILVGFLFGALGFIHVRKLLELGRPLFIWELSQARQILALFPSVGTPLEWLLVALAACAVLGLFVWLALHPPRWKPRLRSRLAAGALSLGVLLLVPSQGAARVMQRWGIFHETWDLQRSYSQNGFLLSLVMGARSTRASRPAHYSRAAVEQALGPHRAQPAPPAAGDAVDVLVYMAEAFWDPLQLGVTFDRDPIPFVRSLLQKSPRRAFVSSVYGGGTSEVEFELLSGIPIAALPAGIIPYHHVARPLETLASVFRDRGYRTVGVHNFHGWFWTRRATYPLLGFDRFLALEDMPGAPLEGPFPSDEALVDRAIDQLGAGAPGDPPVFMLAITMVSHGMYSYQLEGGPEVRLTDEQVTEPTRHALQNYATALLRADRAFKRLVESLERRERPTLVIFFGDHLPALGHKFAIYRERGFVPPEWTFDDCAHSDCAHMLTTPLLFLGPGAERVPEGMVGASSLGVRILQAAGIEPTGYFALAREVAEKAPVITPRMIIDAAGGRHSPGSADLPPALYETLNRLSLLAYDRLLGQGYSLSQ